MGDPIHCDMAQYLTQEQYQALLQQQPLQQQQALVQQQQQQHHLQYYQEAAVQQQRQVNVTLPAGAAPGMQLSFQTPEGGSHTFVVPNGCGPGMQVTVTY